ncbi:MAG: VWA domain-containing protein [Candidatus Korobacteraceae bacterium]|jgi:Ca-activated chloride channel family protein
MKYWLILVLAAALPWGLVAQDTPQQQLPTAPSAIKYPPPPPPATPPPATEPAPAPPQTTSTSQPAAQSGNSSAASPQSNSQPSNDSPQSSQSDGATKPGASAAGSGSGVDDSIPLIRKRVDEVNVVFTVTDKRDHFVKDLTQSDFRVIDNNKPANIQSFSRQTNLPLRVGLLIDASNSVRDRFKFEQEAAIEFLNQIIRLRYDKAFVIGFDTTPEVTQDFTDDTQALSHGVRMLRAGGGTAMYDAIYFACRDKLMQADKGELATRRAIILLSDGEDNQSRVSREEAVEMAQRAEVIIYAISTNTSGIKLRGDKILEYFAEQTGGKAFFPFKIEDVANAFTEISDELRSQYAISYKPADFIPDGKYRKIEIVAENKKYHVRARKGYYAPRQ